MLKTGIAALLVTILAVCFLLLVPAPEFLKPPASTAPPGTSLSKPPVPTTSSAAPTVPTTSPSIPTTAPTIPTTAPTVPTTAPTIPTTAPTIPTTAPTISTTAPTIPTTAPTTKPTAKPTTKPTTQPTTKPHVPDVMLPNYVLDAKVAFVYDANKEQMLFQQGLSGTRVYPASITKLFTSLVALQILDPDTVVTVGKEVDLIDPDSSRAKVYEGNQLTVRMLVQAMLMPSGNDAAYAIAAAGGYKLAGTTNITPKQAVEKFVDEMNRQAKALGLTGTHWENPDGIHSKNHYTTPADLLKIAALSMENEIIARYTAMESANVTFVSGQKRTWKNTNALLQSSSKFYAPEAVGLKTGYTKEAGQCLLSAFKKGDGYIFICVMNASSSDKRFQDSYALYKHYVKED